MQIITAAECEEWVKATLGSDFGHTLFELYYPHAATFQLPADVHTRTVLARTLTYSIDTSQCGLFWITAWGIFPSAENTRLFDGYRRSLGEARDIRLAPGHVFDASDLDEIECLLDLALYFFWDAVIFVGQGAAVQFSHDEWLSIHARSTGRLAQLQMNIERLSLRKFD
jgi:hypothetical protein